MKWILIPAFLLVFFIFNHQVLFAENYHCSTVSEVHSAIASGQPGDTLFLATGEWTDCQLTLKANGTEENPIVICAEIPGKTKFTGASNMCIAGSWLVVCGFKFIDGYSPSGAVVEFRRTSSDVATNCRLTNSAIINYNPADKSTNYKWISLFGQYNRVDHCYLEGKNHMGTTLVVWLSSVPNYHQIDHNYFAHRPDLGENGGETIRIGTSDYSLNDSYTIVEYNYFESCDGEVEIISNKSCENIYRYNTFYESAGSLTLRHGERCYVYGNFFFGNNKMNTGGVRIIGADHYVYNNYFSDLKGTGYRSAISIMNGVPDSPLYRYFQVQRAQIVYNTLVNCYENIEIGSGADDEKTLPPEDCIIANNAIYSKWTKSIIKEVDEAVNLTWQSNYFYGSSLGIDLPDGINWENPQFVVGTDGLWRPGFASPLLETAQGTYEYVTTDMDGQLRETPFDVGADQVSSEPIVITPVNVDVTGPDWDVYATAIIDKKESSKFPTDYSLMTSYPNPFNPETTIVYELENSDYVHLQILDVQGQLIETLVNSNKSAGTYKKKWQPKQQASGVYFAVLRTKENIISHKLILLH